MMIIINISQAKAWVTLMKEADDGDGTLTYEVLFMLLMIFYAVGAFDDGDFDAFFGVHAFNDQLFSSITLPAIKEFNEMVRKAQKIMGGE